MSRILLDTSALLCHFFDESGADRVDALLVDAEVHLASPTILEFIAVARGRGVSRADAEDALAQWRDVAESVVPITEHVAILGIELRLGVAHRVPTVDCLIAGAARQIGAELIHRDAHLRDVPREFLIQTWIGGE